MSTRFGLLLVVAGLVLASCTGNPPVLQEVRFAQPAPAASAPQQP